MIWRQPIKTLHFFLLITLFRYSAKAQEPLNTQIQFSNIIRNPALAGMQVSDLCINLTYQFQNRSFLIPYRFLQVQIESSYKNNESLEGVTAGALIRYEEVGINLLKRAQFLPVLNFHKSLSDINVCFLNMAFMPGIYKSQFEQSILPNTKNYNPIPFNPSSPVPQTVTANSSTYLDFSTGISFYDELNNRISFYLGAALFHFSQNTLKQNQSISKMPREWVINSGLFLNDNNYSLKLLGDVRINHSETSIYGGFIGGLPISKNLLNQCTELNIGAYYNSKQELSPIISIKWPTTNLSFSYTFYTGSIKGMPLLPNAFECNFSKSIDCHKKTTETEKMKCTNRY